MLNQEANPKFGIKEWVYENLVEGVARNGVKVQVGAAVNQGDRFFFQ